MKIIDQLRGLASDLKLKWDVFRFHLTYELGIIAIFLYFSFLVVLVIPQSILHGLLSRLIQFVPTIFFGTVFMGALTLITQPPAKAEALDKYAFVKAQEKIIELQKIVVDAEEKLKILYDMLTTDKDEEKITKMLQELSSLFEENVGMRLRGIKVYLMYWAPRVHILSSRAFVYLLLLVVLYVSLGLVEDSPWYYVMSIVTALYALRGIWLSIALGKALYIPFRN